MFERFYPGWGLAVLRLALGVVFFVHGWDKVFGIDGVSAFAGQLASMGIPAAGAMAWFVALLELLGGLLLLIGWLTRWVSLLLGFEMLVAWFAVHAPNGFFVSDGGYEFTMVLFAGLACLVLAGSGKLAVDDWLILRRAAMAGD